MPRTAVFRHSRARESPRQYSQHTCLHCVACMRRGALAVHTLPVLSARLSEHLRPDLRHRQARRPYLDAAPSDGEDGEDGGETSTPSSSACSCSCSGSGSLISPDGSDPPTGSHPPSEGLPFLGSVTAKVCTQNTPPFLSNANPTTTSKNQSRKIFSRCPWD